jgi:hypothetical protein
MDKKKNNHLKIDEVRQKFKERNFELLEDTYVNNRMRMRYLCNTCNIVDTTSYHNFNQLSGCKNCKKLILELEKRNKILNTPRKIRRTITFDIVKQEFEDNGCKLISTEYKNNSTKLDYICYCGAESSKSYNCFQYKKGCMVCSGTPKYTLEEVQKFFIDRECELLDNIYVSCGSIMNYICSCGNVSKISLSNLLRGHKCRECREYHHKYDTDYVIEELNKISYTLVSDKYCEFDASMEMLCDNKHSITMSWRMFLDGKRCKTCKKDQSIIKLKECFVEKEPEEFCTEAIESQETCEEINVDIKENEFVEYMKNNISNEELQLFAKSFWLYLKFNQETDFVIDFDDTWKWLGYNRKEEAKRALVKNFCKDNQYIVKKIAPQSCGAKNENRGVIIKNKFY